MILNKKLVYLAERRQQLVVQAAAQRKALAQNMAPLRQPLATVDRGIRVVRYIKQHPAFAIGATTLFGLLRRTRLAKWLRSGGSVLFIAGNLRKLL